MIQDQPNDTENKIKDFLLELYREKGSSTSPLFNYIDYENFSNDLKFIFEDNSFIINNLDNNITHYLHRKIYTNNNNNNNESNVSIKNDSANNFSIQKHEFVDQDVLFDDFKKQVTKDQKEITLPNLKNIPKGGMQSFNFIVCVTIPSSVVEIGELAFYHIHSLKEIHFTKNSNLRTIKRSAFNACINLTTFDIPESVISIEIEAFRSCQCLEKVKIPPHLKSLENFVFYDCISLQEVTFSNDIETIGVSAFFNCKSLTSIVIPSAEKIDNTAFQDRKELKYVKLPASLKFIGYQTFENCIKLKKVEIEQNSQLSSIGEQAFWNCPLLDEIEIPASAIADSNAFDAKLDINRI